MFYIVYYIIASPVLTTIQIYKWNKNRKWRKNVKVGDYCFFKNVFGIKMYGYVATLSNDAKSVRVESIGFVSCTYRWHNIDHLSIV
jgi:hypothetical protein